MIQQEAFRCKAITQRLLEFSRGGERRREPTDLAELIQSVLDVVQHLQNYKGKQVLFEPLGPITAWINCCSLSLSRSKKGCGEAVMSDMVSSPVEWARGPVPLRVPPCCPCCRDLDFRMPTQAAIQGPPSYSI